MAAFRSVGATMSAIYDPETSARYRAIATRLRGVAARHHGELATALIQTAHDYERDADQVDHCHPAFIKRR